MNEVDTDLIVVGGGPAGSTLATLVAMRGHRVLLFERQAFPRYSIGESLLPATLSVCCMLGASERLERAGFVRKTGGLWRWGTDAREINVDFQLVVPKPIIGDAYAYQVERAKFDAILLENAKDHGVTVIATTVVDLVEDHGQVVGVRHRDKNGNLTTVTARWVADASGHAGEFYRACGTRVMADRFRNTALFAYYAGAKRLPPPRSGNIICNSFADGWFWFIPLSEELTSVGAVVPSRLNHMIGEDKERAMQFFLRACPFIKDLLGPARRVTEGMYGAYRTRRDWSYSNTRFAKPGLVLVGDCACFVDPLFSSGVHLATYGALLAARSINSVLSGAIDQRRALAEFEIRYRHEYLCFYRFLSVFYDISRSTDAYFAEAQKIVRGNESDRVAFTNLISGWSAEHRSTEAHLSVLAKLSDRTSTYSQVLLPSAAFGSADAKGVAGASDHPLIPSTDGLSWRAA